MLTLAFVTKPSLADEPDTPENNDPTLILDSEEETCFDILPDEPADFNFTSSVSTGSLAVSYNLTAISDNDNPLIYINISGGDFLSPTPLPGAGSMPFVINSFSGSATDDESEFTLHISVDESLPDGLYVIVITYKATTEEPEFFRFTIDTRMTDTLDTDPSHYSGTSTTFSIPTNPGTLSSPNYTYDWVVDWGDDSPLEPVTGTSYASGPGIFHDYASTGGADEYTITIYSNGVATNGAAFFGVGRADRNR